MSRREVRICDVCDRKEEKETGGARKGFREWNVIEYTGIGTQAVTTVDLCPVCTDAMSNWMHERRKEQTKNKE